MITFLPAHTSVASAGASFLVLGLVLQKKEVDQARMQEKTVLRGLEYISEEPLTNQGCLD